MRGGGGQKERGKKHSHQTMLLGEYNVGPGKKTSAHQEQ